MATRRVKKPSPKPSPALTPVEPLGAAPEGPAAEARQTICQPAA